MRTALLVIDMLNRYEHEDAGSLAESVAGVVPNIRRLVDAAATQDALVVYVNDNHDDWAAGRDELIRWALDGEQPELVEPIAPASDVPLLLKARHSAFYATQLEYLLRSRAVERIVLTGQVTEQCILYSTLDAHIRHFDVAVPRDAVAHIHPELGDAALTMMERNMAATVRDTDDLIEFLT
ncbi:cysteine hydrolase family protein [Microlunatus soli]|uniref:Nicotinamidase-related amidase n=1 Tax=Microlunatus soli TaxID=630515 RepID=A0A1H1NAC2_9ACTN|nr:isochorismatase family cysteine hydrolase [Microlunatus soli]SDR95897.1 Nicotinamidase-related amidase [Microlunatus soli]